MSHPMQLTGFSLRPQNEYFIFFYNRLVAKDNSINDGHITVMVGLISGIVNRLQAGIGITWVCWDRQTRELAGRSRFS